MTITNERSEANSAECEPRVSHDAWKGIDLDVPRYYIATRGHIVFSQDDKTERVAKNDEPTTQVVGQEERRFIEPLHDSRVQELASASPEEFCNFMDGISAAYPTFSYATNQMRAETEANYERMLVAGHIRHESGVFDAVQAEAMWTVFDRRNYAMNVAPAGFVIEQAKQSVREITTPDIAAFAS